MVQGRTWSRDISDVRKMKSESVTERSSKLQTQIKIQTDFTYTCVQILKSIISGFLQPLNPGASDSECVYLSNDILISHPSIPSSYSVHSSSEATSKMLKKEVTYQPLLAPLSTTNLMLEVSELKNVNSNLHNFVFVISTANTALATLRSRHSTSESNIASSYSCPA